MPAVVSPPCRVFKRLGDGVLARVMPARTLGFGRHRIRHALDRAEAAWGQTQVRAQPLSSSINIALHVHAL